MAIEPINGITPTPPEITGQPPQTEFMSLDEFSSLTRFVDSVELISPSARDIELGFKGDLMAVDDQMILGSGSKPELVPKFSIMLARHLTTQERGVFFIAKMDNIRSAIRIREKGQYTTTGSEDEQRALRAQRGTKDFYRNNSDLVNSYIETMLSKPATPIPAAERFSRS